MNFEGRINELRVIVNNPNARLDDETRGLIQTFLDLHAYQKRFITLIKLREDSEQRPV